MDALRPQFWTLPLRDLTRAEWEALCDGCGQCCLHKLEDEDTGEILPTNVACKLLDTGTGQCKDYRNRKAYVPDCLRLTMRNLGDQSWLPASCAYRLRADGDPLPSWHYLISGSRETVREAGYSIIGRVICETEAGPLEHHLTDWPDVGETLYEEPDDDDDATAACDLASKREDTLP